MSKLQVYHCITLEQRIWLLCSVSAIPVNKILLQELNQLIGIKILTSDFLEIFGSLSNFRGSNGQFALLRTPMKIAPRISLKANVLWLRIVKQIIAKLISA